MRFEVCICFGYAYVRRVASRRFPGPLFVRMRGRWTEELFTHHMQEGGDGRSVPASLSEGIDWEELAAKIRGGTVGGLGKYALGLFLNNEVRGWLVAFDDARCEKNGLSNLARHEALSPFTHHIHTTPFQGTDTQGAVWLNKKNKEMVLCFRGTEIAWKDLLTDALIIQQPLDGTKQGACMLDGTDRHRHCPTTGAHRTPTAIPPPKPTHTANDRQAARALGLPPGLPIHPAGSLYRPVLRHARRPARVEDRRLRAFPGSVRLVFHTRRIDLLPNVSWDTKPSPTQNCRSHRRRPRHAHGARSGPHLPGARQVGPPADVQLRCPEGWQHGL